MLVALGTVYSGVKACWLTGVVGMATVWRVAERRPPPPRLRMLWERAWVGRDWSRGMRTGGPPA